MKGFFEEYGTFVVTAIIALMVISFLLDSIILPDGALHKFIIINMENMGAKVVSHSGG